MRGILLAMDGVLADTYPLYQECVRRLFQDAFSVTLQNDELSFVIRMEVMVRRIALSRHLSLDRVPVSDMLNTTYAGLCGTLALDPGARAFIGHCQEAGIRIMPVCRQNKVVSLLTLKALSFSVPSSGLVAAQEAVRAKDLHRFIAAGLGLDVSDCLVVEGTEEGIREAKQAGFVTGAVTSYVDAKTAETADFIISSLEAVQAFHTPEAFATAISSLRGTAKAVRYGHSLVVPSKPLQDHETLVSLTRKAAEQAWKHAYCPYSHFPVGAALVSAATGRIYQGCNVENGSYGATICAERNAILSAIAQEGVIGIDLLVVVSDDNPPAPPCAQCLQVLSEFSRPETEVHLFSIDGMIHRVYRFGELLPHPFVLEQS
ncbi:MAG: cytidine deaminase [Sphaerochaeta sp.]|jgi:cytidine deaminase|nr:cytidine deaminase [Sphaerochaeta sp.]